MTRCKSEVTRLLEAWSDGSSEALEELMPLVFDDVRQMARGYFQRGEPEGTLQPTALVNEVYLRFTGLRTVHWKNSRHFFGSAAQMMRRILVDRARRRKSYKRGGHVIKLPVEPSLLAAEVRAEELVALDDALDALERFDTRKRQVVELKFFCGLTNEEIAEVLGVVKSTVIRDWKNARAWLLHELDQRRETDEEQESRNQGH